MGRALPAAGIDIFAVRQWPGNVADIDFACVIREAPCFLIVGRHVPEVGVVDVERASSVAGEAGGF